MERTSATFPRNPRFTRAERQACKAAFDRDEVVAAYVFGSVATGNATPLSDVDLAYLGSDAAAEERVFDTLYETLQNLLGEGRFDLVPLRRAPLRIQFQVATEGELLLCRDPAREERFRAQAMVRYLDFKPYRDAYFAGGM